jgi:hypothetical protein
MILKILVGLPDLLKLIDKLFNRADANNAKANEVEATQRHAQKVDSWSAAVDAAAGDGVPSSTPTAEQSRSTEGSSGIQESRSGGAELREGSGQNDSRSGTAN